MIIKKIGYNNKRVTILSLKTSLKWKISTTHKPLTTHKTTNVLSQLNVQTKHCVVDTFPSFCGLKALNNEYLAHKYMQCLKLVELNLIMKKVDITITYTSQCKTKNGIQFDFSTKRNIVKQTKFS